MATKEAITVIMAGIEAVAGAGEAAAITIMETIMEMVEVAETAGTTAAGAAMAMEVATGVEEVAVGEAISATTVTTETIRMTTDNIARHLQTTPTHTVAVSTATTTASRWACRASAEG